MNQNYFDRIKTFWAEKKKFEQNQKFLVQTEIDISLLDPFPKSSTSVLFFLPGQHHFGPTEGSGTNYYLI